MQPIGFQFRGRACELIIPDGERYLQSARDVIEGRSYPFWPQDGVSSVVDLGAHVGEFTIMAAVMWPHAMIHAYEPNPEVLPLLVANCGPYPNVRIYEQAAAAEAGRGKLYFNPTIGSLNSTIRTPAASAEQLAAWPCAEVDLAGPEQILARQPDVLKIDIEGMEDLLLDAMKNAVTRIGRIYVEFHQEQIRLNVDHLLIPTHKLAYARIDQPEQGELMYVKR